MSKCFCIISNPLLYPDICFEFPCRECSAIGATWGTSSATHSHCNPDLTIRAVIGEQQRSPTHLLGFARKVKKRTEPYWAIARRRLGPHARSRSSHSRPGRYIREHRGDLVTATGGPFMQASSTRRPGRVTKPGDSMTRRRSGSWPAYTWVPSGFAGTKIRGC